MYKIFSTILIASCFCVSTAFSAKISLSLDPSIDQLKSPIILKEITHRFSLDSGQIMTGSTSIGALSKNDLFSMIALSNELYAKFSINRANGDYIRLVLGYIDYQNGKEIQVFPSSCNIKIESNEVNVVFGKNDCRVS